MTHEWIIHEAATIVYKASFQILPFWATHHMLLKRSIEDLILLVFAIISVFIYDCLHILIGEVQFIWCKEWSAGKLAYIWMKFLCSLFLCTAALATFFTQSVVFNARADHTQVLLLPCLSWVFFAGLILITETSFVIQCMRIYAIYNRAKWLKTSLVIFFFVSVTASVIAIHYPLDPSSTVHYGGARLQGFAYPQWFLITSLTSESIFLSLIMYKAWECRRSRARDVLHWRSTGSENFLDGLIQDSIKYYVVIFFVYAFSLSIIVVRPFEKLFIDSPLVRPLFQSSRIHSSMLHQFAKI
ncbi:hypothetical protein SCHPADRAFT_907943 [Schizopora paradoxa]|uniref:DUF6533 domain-containing protein n=1 Tax=Schizopora paradoxa TaxID=27342 RepID=A0A0H2RBK1_9AGAM|nr:hypothetical protein SCHPADRAFT_907943 [Schizopora paradoxa]